MGHGYIWVLWIKKILTLPTSCKLGRRVLLPGGKWGNHGIKCIRNAGLAKLAREEGGPRRENTGKTFPKITSLSPASGYFQHIPGRKVPLLSKTLKLPALLLWAPRYSYLYVCFSVSFKPRIPTEVSHILALAPPAVSWWK